jgi:DNA replication protein DnaC
MKAGVSRTAPDAPDHIATWNALAPAALSRQLRRGERSRSALRKKGVNFERRSGGNFRCRLTLGLHGMAKAFVELSGNDEAKALDRNDWLALLLDREASLRRDKRLTARLRAAKLRQQASVEDVDYRAVRGLDRALFQKLAEGAWIDAHDNLALVGPSGVGKSWLACAIGQKACRDNRSVVYHRWPKLCEELALARGDGRHPRLIKSLGRADLLILDDFGLEPLDAAARHDLLEILEERYGRRSTIVTAQLPVSAWHEVIGDPTYADTILDRLVHNAHRIELTGESLRRARAKTTKTA